MAFDVSGFSKAEFNHRTKTFSAKQLGGLADWFTESDESTNHWIVRGLSAAELSKAEIAARGGRKALQDALETHLNEGMDGLAASILATQEIGENLDFLTALRVEVLSIGSVTPQIDVSVAAKIGKNFPTEFRLLSEAVLTLTGKGGEVDTKKKQQHFGQTTELKTEFT